MASVDQRSAADIQREIDDERSALARTLDEIHDRVSVERATDFFDEQPLVAGALALAVGAAIGGMLPRTRQEDVALGSYRDQVFKEAERIYRDERHRLESVLHETASEATHLAKDHLANGVKGEVERGIQGTADIARAKFAQSEEKASDSVDQVTQEVVKPDGRTAEKQGPSSRG